jgi:hypothetical protein
MLPFEESNPERFEVMMAAHAAGRTAYQWNGEWYGVDLRTDDEFDAESAMDEQFYDNES